MRLLFGRSLWDSRTEEQKHRCSVSFTSCLFSTASVFCGAVGTFFPSPSLAADPIYGRSDLSQLWEATGCGFFLWNLIAECMGKSLRWGNFLHHTST
jgi:hypothetical protein